MKSRLVLFPSIAPRVAGPQLCWWHLHCGSWCLCAHLLCFGKHQLPRREQVWLFSFILLWITLQGDHSTSNISIPPDSYGTCQLMEESFISCSNCCWTALWKMLVSYLSAPNWPLRAASVGLSFRNITRSGLGSPTSGCMHQSRLKPCAHSVR